MTGELFLMPVHQGSSIWTLQIRFDKFERAQEKHYVTNEAGLLSQRNMFYVNLVKNNEQHYCAYLNKLLDNLYS